MIIIGLYCVIRQEITDMVIGFAHLLLKCDVEVNLKTYTYQMITSNYQLKKITRDIIFPVMRYFLLAQPVSKLSLLSEKLQFTIIRLYIVKYMEINIFLE